jgi:hypothetical protein
MAWIFATDAWKQNRRAFTKPDGTADYYAAFASDFYDDLMADYGKLREVGPILSSPVVVDNVIYVGGTDGITR